MGILVAAIFAASTNVSHAKAVTARKSATAELELLFGAIRPEPREHKSSEELRLTRFVSMEDICSTLEAAAATHELPVSFFVRLIWQESRFRPDVVSRAGARGIAQFMPGTARERGLANPFDPIQSLHKSADFLRELREQFGNLGLAAAAYNGGPGRVRAWLNGRGGLPSETRQYVQIVTGAPAERWRGRGTARFRTKEFQIKFRARRWLRWRPRTRTSSGRCRCGRWRPKCGARTRRQSFGWTVMLAGSFSQDKAQRRSAMVARKFRVVLNGRKPTVVNGRVAGRGKAHMSHVRITETDRVNAEKLCAKLRAGGAGCVVARAS